MKLRTMLTVAVLGAAVGCGGSEQREAEQAAREAADAVQQGAETARQGAEDAAASGLEGLASGLNQMAQGLQQMAQSDVEVVDFEVLKAALPQVEGWTQANARGEQMSAPIRHSRAEAQYSQGNSSIELEITDSAMNQLLLAPMSMFLSTGFSERSDEGFKRATEIGGNPGLEEWNSASRRAEVTAVVANRFIVQATGHGVDDIESVRQFVEAVNLSQLAGTN